MPSQERPINQGELNAAKTAYYTDIIVMLFLVFNAKLYVGYIYR